MTNPAVQVERIEGVALVTVSDVKRRNAMTATLSERLSTVIAGLEADAGVNAIVIAGDDQAGRVFCAGGDLDALSAAGESGRESLERIYSGFLAVAHCALPTFAAIDGPAIGAGLNLALAADVRVAGETARFEAGFLRLGVHPGGGMTWMAQRVLGPQVTTAMLLGGESLDAGRAFEAGLVLRVATGEGQDGRSSAVTEALRMAGYAAAAPRRLVLDTKASQRATATLEQHHEAVSIEAGPQLDSLRSEGFKEGLQKIRTRTGKRRSR